MSNLATVEITINRNQACPVFNRPFNGFVGTVQEDAAIGQTVLIVTASDADIVSIFKIK